MPKQIPAFLTRPIQDTIVTLIFGMHCNLADLKTGEVDGVVFCINIIL